MQQELQFTFFHSISYLVKCVKTLKNKIVIVLPIFTPAAAVAVGKTDSGGEVMGQPWPPVTLVSGQHDVRAPLPVGTSLDQRDYK